MWVFIFVHGSDAQCNFIFHRSVKQKFGFHDEDVIRLVMEEDGTNVDIDKDLLMVLGTSTTYVVLLENEQWRDNNPANNVNINIMCLQL